MVTGDMSVNVVSEVQPDFNLEVGSFKSGAAGRNLRIQ